MKITKVDRLPGDRVESCTYGNLATGMCFEFDDPTLPSAITGLLRKSRKGYMCLITGIEVVASMSTRYSIATYLVTTMAVEILYRPRLLAL